MTSRLVAPDINRSFSLSSDWLEVLALARPQKYATDTDLTTGNDILEDRAAGFADDDDSDWPEEDPDILDPVTERTIDAVFEELGTRSRVLGQAYPFRLEIRQRRLRLTVLEAGDDEVIEQGRAIYVACLYMTAIRGGLIDVRAAAITPDPGMGNAFQICATIAAAGYVSGDAYWIGHPRPDGTSFMDAVRNLAALLRYGTPAAALPPGESSNVLDGGVDVVAWRDHHDARPAKLILYGQCASGMNWPGKPVRNKVDRLDGYYTTTPSKHWLPALLTPFPIYFDHEKTHRLRTEDDVKAFYRQTEAEMGIIIDRLRIVAWCVEALRDVQPSMKVAVDRLNDLFAWSRVASDAAKFVA